MTEYIELENVLLEYIEKYGLTNAARAYFQRVQETRLNSQVCRSAGIPVMGKEDGNACLS